MNRVSASPVLQEARAMGRAFRGAGRALRRPWTWLVLLVVGTLLPWFAFLSFGPFGMSPGTGVAAMFDSVLALAPFVATQCALIVLLLALLVPVLEGGPVRLGRLRPPAIRLVGAAATLTGADMAWHAAAVSGVRDPLAGALGWDGPNTMALGACLVQACVAAMVIAAMQAGREWRWRARHLIGAGAFMFLGLIATSTVGAWLQEGILDPEWPFSLGWWGPPPIWWVIWWGTDMLVRLFALEYLRAVPAEAPVEAAP